MNFYTPYKPMRKKHRLLFKIILTMKLTFLFTVLICVQASATGFAQQVTLSERNISLKKAFSVIQKQTKYVIWYENDLLQGTHNVNLSLNNASLQQALDACFKDQPLTYTIVDKNIVLQRKTALNTIKIYSEIKGTVKDEKGLGLPGVSVKVKGSSIASLTNGSGIYSISAPDGPVTLVFSYIGYETQEVAVTGKTEVNVQLKTSSSSLTDVVVVGYGTQKKTNLVSSVATVSGEVLENRPLVNLAQGLQGVLPNLNINLNNGAPGKGASFNIRGFTSMNGGDPLVLVDGVVMDPNLINPSDVESVSLLKDAGAVAIYGSRAAFGVLLITTKNPNKNTAPKFSVNSAYSSSRQTYLPQYLNSVDYVRMFMEADQTGKNGGTAAGEPFTDKDLEMTVKYFNDPANNSPVYPDPSNPNKYRYVGNTNWLDVLYPGWAPMLDNNISISGGQGKIAYMASLGNLNQTGLLKEADQKFNRYNATLKLSAEVTSWLDLNFKSTLNRTTYNTANVPGTTGATFDFAFIPTDLRPVMPVKHPDGNYAGQGNYTNMVGVMAQNGRATDVKNDLWLTGGFVLKPLKNFKVVGDLTWNNYAENITTQFKKFNEYGVNGVLLGTYPWTTPDRIFRSNASDNYHAINVYAEYGNTFFNDHSVKLMVGYNEELKQANSFNVIANNQLDPGLISLTPNSDATAVSSAVGNSLSEWAVQGAFLRFNYDYKNKYLLQVTGRQDATSRYAKGQRTVFTPSVSLGWRVSSESFFEPIKSVISDLKIRGSYGTSPNQVSGSNYPYIVTMPTGQSSYIFGSQKGNVVTAPGLVSTSFTWEKVTSKNIGLDLTAFKNKLDLSFDLYQRDTKGILRPGFAVPAVLGTAVPQRNSADVRTKGWELSVGWKDKIVSDLNYNLRLALSDNQAVVTKYENNPTGSLSDYYNGQKIGEVWGLVTDRFFNSDAEAAATNQAQVWGGKWLAGDLKYVDLDGNGKIDYGTNTLGNPGDQKVLGNNAPRYQFGLNLGLNYKGFDFTGFVQGTLKRDFWLGGNYFWGFTSEYAVPMNYNMDYWTPSNTEAYYPRLRFGGGGNFATQSKYKQNAAYARIKQLTLGYTFNNALLKKAKISKLRIYATGQNLFTITELNEGFDPELLGTTNYPLSKSFSFGLQLGF
ncbi:hypothetical protein CA265_06685 [Sphingobacteriaceae bacterium GW460-11-11-14-LB5]|nr:hypothetical protein CA265_06685 [Sphingobacteriaceae bacterium GW460-11-11-14-LB5]